MRHYLISIGSSCYYPFYQIELRGLWSKDRFLVVKKQLPGFRSKECGIWLRELNNLYREAALCSYCNEEEETGEELRYSLNSLE